MSGLAENDVEEEKWTLRKKKRRIEKRKINCDWTKSN